MGRRSLLAGAAASGVSRIVRPVADYSFTQFHNQAAPGTLHKNLTQMWEVVHRQSSARV
jgi:hypothetical protein